MKFRTIFILFNVILVVSFGFMFVMPFALLGTGYTMSFWASNWPLGAFFLAVLAAFNAFFIANWQMFTLVEKEDWTTLETWLRVRLFDRGRTDRRYVRLFINVCLLRGDMESIAQLEARLAEKQPAALRRDAVLFAAARLLANDPAKSEAFLAPYLDGKGVDHAPWLRFYHAFSLVLLQRADEAAPALESNLGARDPVLAALSAYLLGSLSAAASAPERRDALVAAAGKARDALLAGMDAARWSKETERARGEVHIVIMSKLIDEAGAWLYPGSVAERAAGTPTPAKA